MTPRLCQHEHFMCCGQVRVDALFFNTFKLPKSSPAANIESMKLLTHLALSSKLIDYPEFPDICTGVCFGNIESRIETRILFNGSRRMAFMVMMLALH